MTIQTTIRLGNTYSGSTIVPAAADTIALIKILLSARGADGEPLTFTLEGEEIDIAAEVEKQFEAAP